MLKRFLYLFICFPIFLSAQSLKLKEMGDQKKKALEEIQTTNLLLKETKNNTAALLNRIQLIQSQIQIRKHLLQLLEEEMQQLSLDQKAIADEIKVLEKALAEKKKMYHKAITAIMRNNTKGSNTLLFLLGGNSLSEMFKRFHYLKDYSRWVKDEASIIKKSEADLTMKQDSLNLAVTQQKIVQVQYQQENKQLLEEEDTFKAGVKEAKLKEKELNKILSEKRAQATNLDKKLQDLVVQEEKRQADIVKKEKEISAKLEAQRKKADSEKTKTEKETEPKAIDNVLVAKEPEPVKPKEENKQTKPENISNTKPIFAEHKKIMSSTEQDKIKLSSSFVNNRGKLPYPITGKYTIVGRFGNHKETTFVTTTKGGIDIRSQANAKAKAVFNGEVSAIVSIPGYGTCILLRHGDYYTFYGNINQINVAKGEKVETGQILGSVFTDPQTNVSEMHFQLWKQKQKLNPEPWLRR